MTLNGYFMLNSLFVPAVLLRAFDFQSAPQKTNEGIDAQNQRRRWRWM